MRFAQSRLPLPMYGRLVLGSPTAASNISSDIAKCPYAASKTGGLGDDDLLFLFPTRQSKEDGTGRVATREGSVGLRLPRNSRGFRVAKGFHGGEVRKMNCENCGHPLGMTYHPQPFCSHACRRQHKARKRRKRLQRFRSNYPVVARILRVN